MENIPYLLEIIKIMETLTTWRFVALWLLPIVLLFIWKMPEIVKAFK